MHGDQVTSACILQKPPSLAVEAVTARLRDSVSVPDCRELSVASSSVSCIAAEPEVVCAKAQFCCLVQTVLSAEHKIFLCVQTPLHLDIPYVAASPLSHSNTLASIERYNTPRSHYGPISEAGKAIVAARKDSMRQEHLAAIAHLNTFAKKRASKLSTSQSGVISALFAKHTCRVVVVLYMRKS